jgi:hypothetical protein
MTRKIKYNAARLDVPIEKTSLLHHALGRRPEISNPRNPKNAINLAIDPRKVVIHELVANPDPVIET